VDLQLFLRVLWRFRLLIAAGFVLAIVLATLAFVRVDTAEGSFRLTYREQEKWESLSTVFVTTKGFPWGSVNYGSEDASGGGGSVPAADPGRLTTLAAIYMQLASGDGVRALMLKDGPIRGVVQTFPVFAANSDTQLPLVTLSAIAASPEEARRLGVRYLQAFLSYLESQQIAGDIDPEDRVRFQVVREPQPAVLLEGRSTTLPILVFLAVMTAVVGLAFVLENLRPRSRPVEPPTAVDPRAPYEPRVTVEPRVATEGRASGRDVARRSA
jgi:hypothetical protein